MLTRLTPVAVATLVVTRHDDRVEQAGALHSGCSKGLRQILC